MHIFSRALLCALIACVAISTYQQSCVSAQELEEVLRSLNRSEDKFKDAEDKPIKDSWINPSSNMAKLFTKQGKGVLTVLEWLGDYSESEFRLKNKTYKRYDEYLKLTVNYSAKSRKSDILMSFLIPHPKYIDLVKTGLLKPFSSLEPPELATIAFEKMVLKNNEANFYHHKGSGCSLLYKLPQHAVLNLYDKKCEDAHALIALAELLSIDRLKQKLES